MDELSDKKKLTDELEDALQTIIKEFNEQFADEHPNALIETKDESEA
jgi:hypothetical protein